MKTLRYVFTVAALAATIALSPSLRAETLRWAAATDITTLDAHANPDAFSDGVLHDIYERLAARDKDYKLVPALATRWEQINPTTLRFFLRPGVKFHDGSVMTADDVVFSLERVRRPTSDHKEAMAGVKSVVKVDAMTVDVISEKPMAPLLAHVSTLAIMNKAWLMRHGAEEPHNYAGNKESYTGRNAMGTGPFKVKSFEPGAKLVLERHNDWWSKHEGNVTEVVFRPIKSNATRIAALLSGEVDLVTDPPQQDVDRLVSDARFKTASTPEHRVLYVTFDLVRDELKYASVKGRNPFKDRRVREAVFLAIDREAIRAKVLRGSAVLTASLVPKGVVGYSEKAAAYAPPDIERAKKLMQEAGYGSGFKVTMDCANEREALCAAVAGMVSKIGIEVAVNSAPRSIFLQRTNPSNRNMSMMIGGMGASTGDATMMLESLLHSYKPDGRGANNAPGVSNPKYDEILAQSGGELDPAKRFAMFESLQMLERDEHAYVPIYQPVLRWVMQRRVNLVQRPDSYLDLRWVKMGG
jgi:peptide/nickel transport system substrate-binding protein